MSRRKKGFSRKLVCENRSVLLKSKKSVVLPSSYSSNKSRLVLGSSSFSSNKYLILLENLYSSNKPGFVDVINKGIDDNCLKGGFKIRK